MKAMCRGLCQGGAASLWPQLPSAQPGSLIRSSTVHERDNIHEVTTENQLGDDVHQNHGDK